MVTHKLMHENRLLHVVIEIFVLIFRGYPKITRNNHNVNNIKRIGYCNTVIVCLFVLRFYGPVNPMGSCRARSIYLVTRLLGRLSPLSG